MKAKTLDKIIQITLGISLALVPLLIVPFFTDIFDFGKGIFLLIVSLIIFVLWTIKTILEKKLTLVKSGFIFPLLVLLVISIISSIVMAPVKVYSFISVSGGAVLLLLTLFFLYTQNLIKPKLAMMFLLGSGAVMSLSTIILSSGLVGQINLPSLNLILSSAFATTGSLLSQAVFLACLIPMGFALSYEYLKEKKNTVAIALFGINLLVLIGLGMTIRLLATTIKPILLSPLFSWMIAVEGLKNVKNALIGIGPSRFLVSFINLRPLTYNASDFWNFRFSSTGWSFQLLTEMGLLGLLSFLFLTVKILKSVVKLIRQKSPSPLSLAIGLSLVIFFIAQFFIPLNISLIFLLFVMLALFEALTVDEKQSIDISPIGNAVYLFLIFPLVLFIGMFYFGTRLVLANGYFLNSLKAAKNNDGTQTYNLQIKAIQVDPWSAIYRNAYSQTNFALANAIASKKDLTENDRNTVSQLVQQSLREARAAVALDTGDISSWENLAGLYRNLINFAEDAEQWSVATYQEAIKLDPINPQLRLDLGGIYFSKKDYQQAAAIFNQAAQIKPDLANAHYNLANSLIQLGALADAKKELEITQSLIKIDSADYQKVSAELEEIKKKLPSPTPAPVETPETLSTPQQPGAGIKPPLELPNENPPITPAQTPEENPVVTP